MFELLCYTKIGDKQIAKFKTPTIPRIGERINADIYQENSIVRIYAKVYDVEYRFDNSGTLKHILIFLDME